MEVEKRQLMKMLYAGSKTLDQDLQTDRLERTDYFLFCTSLFVEEIQSRSPTILGLFCNWCCNGK